MKVTRSVLRYHGGKFRLAPWIISHFPKHRIYCEPFSGAASVLMLKPRVYSEVINDLDGEVVNVFRVLRDAEKGAELERILRLTPFAREELTLSYCPGDSDVERARQTIVRSYQGFGADGTLGKSTGFRSDTSRPGSVPAHDWASFPPHIKTFTARLAGVVIESRAALEVMANHDSESALFYVDPPYVLSTRPRASSHGYRHEMTDDQHREMASVLHSLKGAIVLSGYDCPLYTELFATWWRVQKMTNTDGAKARTETLWLNQRAMDGRAQSSFEEMEISR